MNNWALQYSGGSGGFLLLHLLLLSDKFYSAFRKDLALDQLIQQHWSIVAPNQWKSTEIWPDNQLTFASEVNVDKLYFQCNPHELGLAPKNFPCKKLVLYTDYRSQQLLAYYKKAHWYYSKQFQVHDIKYVELRAFLKSWQEHYRNVKDPSWPKCISVRHLDRLPKHIQTELLADPNMSYFLNFTYRDAADFRGELVHWPMIPFLQSADAVIKLQDLVNSNATILETLFNLPKINSKQLELLNKWKRYHPDELLTNLGITV